MKLKSTLILILLLTGCQPKNPIDLLIQNTSASICGLSLGIEWKAGEALLSSESIIPNSNNPNSYEINCDRNGKFFLGTDQPGSQTFFVQSVLFTIDDDSTVTKLTAIWSELNSEGKRLLEAAGDPSKLPDNRRMLVERWESISVPLNDLVKIRYELDREIGEPHSIRPILWRGENSELTISSMDIAVHEAGYYLGDLETAHFVSSYSK